MTCCRMVGEWDCENDSSPCLFHYLVRLAEKYKAVDVNH